VLDEAAEVDQEEVLSGSGSTVFSIACII
jgi:hypothetical protein